MNKKVSTNFATEPNKTDKRVKNLRVAVLVLAVVLVIGLIAVALKLFVVPQVNAQTALDNAFKNKGSITAVNTEIVVFNGQRLEQTNIEQKALAKNGDVTAPPAFIFNNGKDTTERKIFSYYLDFSDQRSRDALLANKRVLSGFIESGSIELQVYPVLSGRAYSMFAAETLSEVFVTQPDLTWETMFTLLKEGPALVGLDDTKAIADGITKAVERIGVQEVNAESIQNGTFASWLLSIDKDPRLNTTSQIRLPYILVDNKPLDLSLEELNDSDRFKKAVSDKLRQ